MPKKKKKDKIRIFFYYIILWKIYYLLYEKYIFFIINAFRLLKKVHKCKVKSISQKVFEYFFNEMLTINFLFLMKLYEYVENLCVIYRAIIFFLLKYYK